MNAHRSISSLERSSNKSPREQPQRQQEQQQGQHPRREDALLDLPNALSTTAATKPAARKPAPKAINARVKYDPTEMDFLSETKSMQVAGKSNDRPVQGDETYAKAPAAKKKADSPRNLEPLPSIPQKTFELTERDVVCGRHKFALNHEGNRRFRETVAIYLDRYLENTGRAYRSRLSLEIVHAVQLNGGHFLTADGNGKWMEINEKDKRNKVGHALRDAAATLAARYVARPQKTTELRSHDASPRTMMPSLEAFQQRHVDHEQYPPQAFQDHKVDHEHDTHPLDANCEHSANLDLNASDVQKILTCLDRGDLRR
jgi:hypothetical protein